MLTGVDAGNYTVSKFALIITAINQVMTYGGILPNLTYSTSAFANGDTSVVPGGALSTTATAYNGTVGSGSNARTYAITLSNLSAGVTMGNQGSSLTIIGSGVNLPENSIN